MKAVKETVADTTVASGSLDFDDVCDIRSVSPLPKRVTSSLYNDQAEIEASDNDNIGFVGVSQESLNRLDVPSPDVTSEQLFEQGVNGTYDREALLYELANSKQPPLSNVLESAEQKTGTSNIPGDQCLEECQESKVERLREALQALPDSLLHLYTGVNRDGDCGRPSDQKPDWLDPEKLRRGQKFFQDHMFSIQFAELVSFMGLSTFHDNLNVLIISGKSSTPFAAFKRWLSLGIRVRRWYAQDPWDKRTAANKDMSIVRAMHAAVKRRLDTTCNQKTDAATKIPNAWCPTRGILLEDFSEACEAPVSGQCPYATVGDNPGRYKGINQSQMAAAQWAFVGLIVSYPKLLGVHYATDEDLEAFIHLWRSIGYQLGVEDEYNFCRGTLDDVRQRSHDYLHSWVKPNFREITPEYEHVMRCLTTGLSVVMPGLTYETALLYLVEILDLPMPRLYASLSYKDWISHNIMKSLLHYATRIPGIASLMNGACNRMMDQAEKFTPEDIEAIRIKFSSLYPENGVNTNNNLIDM